MFFKLSYLLLFLIVIANSVLAEPEDENEILKESYDDCRKWLLVSLDSTISVAQFWLYMGKTKEDFKFLYDYLKKNPAANEKKDAIDVYLYGELFKNLCGFNGYSVKDCAEFRKSQAPISLEDV